jgi:hypothetical protein
VFAKIVLPPTVSDAVMMGQNAFPVIQHLNLNTLKMINVSILVKTVNSPILNLSVNNAMFRQIAKLALTQANLPAPNAKILNTFKMANVLNPAKMVILP